MRLKVLKPLTFVLVLIASAFVGNSQESTKLRPAEETIRRAEENLPKMIQTENQQFTSFVHDLYKKCLFDKLWEPIPPGLPNRWFSITGKDDTGYGKCQLLWDTMFILNAYAPLDDNTLIRSVFENYWFTVDHNEEAPKGSFRYGMVPCVLNPDLPPVGYSQTPILAWGCLMVYRQTHDRKLLEQCLPYLLAFDHWYSTERDVDDDGLIELGAYKAAQIADLVQSARYESFDFHPAVDGLKLTQHPKRQAGGEWYGNIEGVDSTCALLLSERAIVEIARELGQEELADQTEKIIARRIAAIQAKMWDPKTKFFYSVDRDTDEKILVRTIQAFWTLTSGAAAPDQAEALIKALKDPKQWWSEYPIPTVAMDDPKFKARGFWRGDMWPPTNYLVSLGVMRYGYYDVARELTEKMLKLLGEKGINERYDGTTGDPLGVKNYCWTVLVWNMAVHSLYGVQENYSTIRIPPNVKNRRLKLGKLEVSYPADDAVSLRTGFERKFHVVFPSAGGVVIVTCDGKPLANREFAVSDSEVSFNALPAKTYRVSRSEILNTKKAEKKPEANCQSAKKKKVIIHFDKADIVLNFAVEEISSLLGGDYIVNRSSEDSEAEWKIYLIVDKTMKNFSFCIKCPADTIPNRSRIELRGPDPTCVLHAAYTMLEKAGASYDITGPVPPPRIKLENLIGFSRLIQPAVNRRGIRLHINFAMDISSYSLEEAKAYIRNLARHRMNYLALHSYPGQWYPYPLNGNEYLAGNFFYGQRHDIPDDPVVKNAVRNQKVYCIPEIEPYYDQPEEKSRRAIEWLRAVIGEAKRVGLTVNFSIELREKNRDRSLAICESVLRHYPMIDALEVISQEDSEKAIEEIEYNTKVIQILREKWREKQNLEYAIGIYSTTVQDLKPGFELMRRIAPPEIHLTVLPAHGARVAVKNLAAIPISPEDLTRTMIYSWVEFDGLMYLQQNPVEGIRQLIEEGKRLSRDKPVFGVCWNHWRTAENRTSIRYSALASIEGPINPEHFYRQYGNTLGIGNINAYISAMSELDEADNDARNNLFNIGFCYGGYWNPKDGLANYGRYNKEKIEASIRKFESVLGNLRDCVQRTTLTQGIRYLEFLSNRISCTLLHLRSFNKMTELQPLFANKDPLLFSNGDRKQIREVCDEALNLQNEYLKLHAQMIEDRGCEGTLISYYYSALFLLKQIKKTYGGEGNELAPQPKAPDAPPARLETKNKKMIFLLFFPPIILCR